MWVWGSGAYVAVNAFKGMHGGVSVAFVCNYLIAGCVVQCLIVYAMTLSPAL